MTFHHCLFPCAVLFLSLTACACDETGQPQGQTGLTTTKMTIGNAQFTLEIANTDKSREIGLMHRDSMPADHGMIFVFPTERRLGFWMKNTRIPLDILYTDRNGKVVLIATMKAFDLTSTDSVYPCKYAIELNAGIAKGCGVMVGDVLVVPEEAWDSRD